MKDDIRKYLPDLATVLRETEPSEIKARRDKAVEAFKEQPNEDAEEVVPESSHRPTRPKPAAEPAATASPWVSSAPLVAPKAALPSSLAPAPAPIGAGASERRKLPRWALPVLAALAVVGSLVALWLTVRPKPAPPQVPSAVPAGAPSSSASFIEEGPVVPTAPVPSVARSMTASEPPVSATVKAPAARPKLPKDAAPSTTSAPSAQPTAAPMVQPVPSGLPPIKAEPVEGEREFGR